MWYPIRLIKTIG